MFEYIELGEGQRTGENRIHFWIYERANTRWFANPHGVGQRSFGHVFNNRKTLRASNRVTCVYVLRATQILAGAFGFDVEIILPLFGVYQPIDFFLILLIVQVEIVQDNGWK